ncbi:MAG TPA: hypothetical protein VFN67_17405 [Polyangiales bacterium]|nr:hypothetical protein [Polyangiales bacterium]
MKLAPLFADFAGITSEQRVGCGLGALLVNTLGVHADWACTPAG